MSGPDVDFWQQRFLADHVPWDRGAPSPQLRAWLDDGQLSPQALHGPVAVPGCGAGHEVAELAARGFQVIAIDYAPAAVALTRERLAKGGLHAEVVQADLLSWQPDVPLAAVYEQTCLCALHPDHWTTYAQQLHRWLRPGGQLCVLFMHMHRDGAAQGLVEGPPYHCDINAMRALLPSQRWQWPKPPYALVPHPMGMQELAVILERL
jgi:SAM-dependent methyltransferase